MTLDQLNMCIVDIETTGARYMGHRVIEIGAVKIQNGQCVDTFHTLLNPGRPIPPIITQITGITDKDVVDAPFFEDIHNDFFEFTKDHIFVAHNVRFDYGFLRQEFEELGKKFHLKMLCSVRLSRQLFKEHRRHDLSSIIERHKIEVKSRHRALDDARAVWEFFKVVIREKDAQTQELTLTQLLKAPSIPAKLKTNTDDIPHTPGVYVFYNQEHHPIYIGKAKDLRDRIMSHFSGDIRISKELALSQQVVEIEWINTTGELAALLLESQMIKKFRPLYNRRLLRSWQMTALKVRDHEDGYMRVELQTFKNIFKDDLIGVYSIFKTRKQAKEFLEGIAKEHKLCKVLLGLEKKSREDSCFYDQIEACKGACLMKEPAVAHNMRLTAAISKHRKIKWPFEGPIVLREANASGNKGEIFKIDHWIIEEAIRFEGEARMELFDSQDTFDLDAYRILFSYLRKNKNVDARVLPVVSLQNSMEDC